MEKCDEVDTNENVLAFNVTDDVLERAGCLTEGPAFTLNFCTYNYYQCGPIGRQA